MEYPKFFNSKKTLKLFGLEKEFDFLMNLYIKKKLPKVLMLSGQKGIGKSTLINHFLFLIFDKKNYDKKNFFLNSDSSLYKQFQDNIYPNILYVDGFNFKSVKIEDVRNLKKIIQQSSISNKERFIVLDDVEIFNKSSLNALLKIIEDPLNKNYFFLINNKSKSIMDTIRSRSLEINIMLNEKQRIEIIDSLMSFLIRKKI